MKSILTVIIVTFLGVAVQAQTPAISRVSVVSNDSKTNIWVSDFPKQTSVVVVDAENNILSIVSTNQFGAAFISLPQGITSKVTVKTLNGDVSASNVAVVKKTKEEENVVLNERDNSNKA